MASENCKILVVDDTVFFRIMLKKVLTENGFEVCIAADGKEALEEYSKSPGYDLILSDMNMPVMDGLELIKELRGRNDDIPVMILTSNTDISTALNAIKNGANDYLLKDDNIQETLILSVKNVIEHYKLVKQNIRLMKELEIKNRELERLAFLDGLTGVANRRYFDDNLKKEWAGTAREKAALSLIMMDIDYFKLYNDKYGHQMGDDCLKNVARAINNALKRPVDFLARYGGEEFAAILPRTDITGAVVVAEAIRISVTEAKIPHSNSKVSEYVSLSLGVACVIPEKDIEPAELISMADKALYTAKQKGRNRVEIYGESIII